MFLPILLDFVGNQEPGGFKEFCLPLLTATFCLYPIWRTYVRTAWQYFSPCSYTAMDPENCENTWMQVPGCALLQLGWFVGSTGIISAFLHIQWFVYFALHHPWNHQQEYVWFTYFRHQKKHLEVVCKVLKYETIALQDLQVFAKNKHWWFPLDDDKAGDQKRWWLLRVLVTNLWKDGGPGGLLPG